MKKTKKPRNLKTSRHRRRPGPRHRLASPLTPQRLLRFLGHQGDPLSLQAILQGLDLGRAHRRQVRDLLNRLVDSGQIRRQKNVYSRIRTVENLVRGTFDHNARGFGFVRPEGTSERRNDIFIPAGKTGSALHGDKVLVEVLRSRKGRRDGRIIKVLERSVTRLCGLFVASGRKAASVIPDNEKLPITVTIPPGQERNAPDGAAVTVRITSYGAGGREVIGRVERILGDPWSVQVQLTMAMVQFDLEADFPDQVKAETANLRPLTSITGQRRDLRSLPHVTIDGATAKDFDDAICVQPTANGFCLYVSIADVSHYVRPGSELDREAYRRGTSVYLPGRVIPMLPERLSNDLCSLVPDQDRPAFTAELHFDQQGRRRRARFYKSMIRSHCRYTYDTVHALVYLKNPQLRREHQQRLPMLEAAARLARLLARQRRSRGSLGFIIPEPAVELADDRVATISRANRNEAHQLIEECMLAANEAVAEHLAESRQPVLYRIHEQPDPEKVKVFKQAAASLGLPLPRNAPGPAWFAQVLEEAHGSPAEYVINNLLLRTMQQARYWPENLGHFGLAARYYLHFTSPIRRYPDLIAHRALTALLAHKQSDHPGKERLYTAHADLEEAAVYLSRRERIGVEVERNMAARVAVLFMRDHVGDSFDGIISGVSPHGIYVELFTFFISGIIQPEELGPEPFYHDPRGHQLIGEESGSSYQLGDLVRVRVIRVDLHTKRIFFALVTSKKLEAALPVVRGSNKQKGGG